MGRVVVDSGVGVMVGCCVGVGVTVVVGVGVVVAVGLKLTTTFVVAEAVLPAASCTVNVTVNVPTLP